MQYKVIHYFENLRGAILFAKEVNGKIFDQKNKLVHDFCKEKKGVRR